MKDEVNQPGPRGERAFAGMKVKGEGVKVNLQGGQVWELQKTHQELGYLGGCRPHIPWSPISRMCGTAIEVGHRVVGGTGMAVRACGVISPAYWVSVVYEPWAVSGKSGREVTMRRQGLEGTSIKLLGTNFLVRPQGKYPSLGSEVGVQCDSRILGVLFCEPPPLH